jgi:hypothetical protein
MHFFYSRVQQSRVLLDDHYFKIMFIGELLV